MSRQCNSKKFIEYSGIEQCQNRVTHAELWYDSRGITYWCDTHVLWQNGHHEICPEPCEKLLYE